MDNSHKDLDNTDKKNYNTEYLPTKCRVTKPPPPKPATNPLQFVKVAPCPLYQKAQEQLKKVEETKIARKEVVEEAEDWQQNLDNWKSSRRKRQEHIIERVVEVKKLEQEEQGKARRKNKTFNEMMEERNMGRHKFNIPIYNADDSNDLSDYGIGSSSSKTNSIKDVDTDDNSSVLDEKDNNMYDYASNKDTSSASNQSQSEDETNVRSKSRPSEESFSPDLVTTKTNVYTSNLYSNINKSYTPIKSPSRSSLESRFNVTSTEPIVEKEQYTYEGAIQDYRTRIRSKINIDESVFNRPQDYTKSKESTEVQSIVPKGNIFKRKEIFEVEKPIEISPTESNVSRRLSEDFAKTISIKERLQSLEKCTDQPLKSVDKTTAQVGSVKARLHNFNQHNEADTKNNNTKTKPLRSDITNNNANKISDYLIEKSNSTSSFETKISANDWRNKEIFDRSSSPEAEMYMNKLNMFSRDLDNLMFNKPMHNIENGLDDYVRSSNYPPSTSSTELMTLSSDREDSGIHTADVSCSVSQADEPFEDTDLSSTIPNCIEKLTIAKENELQEQAVENAPALEISKEPLDSLSENNQSKTDVHNNNSFNNSLHNLIKTQTDDFINVERKDSSYNLAVLEIKLNVEKPKIPSTNTKNNAVTSQHPFNENFPSAEIKDDSKIFQKENYTARYSYPENENDNNLLRKNPSPKENSTTSQSSNGNIFLAPTPVKVKDPVEKKPVIYENVEIKLYENMSFPVDFITDDVFGNLAPPKLEPPKVKPPPPPPPDVYDGDEQSDGNFKRLNSTKRIKKEMYIKRSSFLGLDEPTDDQIDPDIPIDKPPDINSFLQKESRFEKSMYKKLQGSRDGGFSEVESQDSGLEIERGRLSSDTWCSSLIDSSTPVHERQDSEQTNSFTSEEDEITKKEREIIELVEKEEKSRDSDYSSQAVSPVNKHKTEKNAFENNLGSKKFDRPYFPPHSGFGNGLNDQDSEVLRVEHELLQLEREELERQRENILFRENRAKFCQNRHSLENICDNVDVYQYNNGVSYRKSMPELQHVHVEYRKSLPDVPNYKPDVEFQYRKSMPDIQHAYNRSVAEYCNNVVQNDVHPHSDRKKSMPELQDIQRMEFRSPPPIIRQPIMPGKPIRPLSKEQRDKERFMMVNPIESDAFQHSNKQIRPLTRHSLHALSAVPRPRHVPNDNWIQPKANNEIKNYNQHWLCQEAELRRIAEQKSQPPTRPWQQPRQEKHIPDSVIQSLTQRVQNRSSVNDRNPVMRSLKSENNSPNKEFVQHQYLGHPQTLGHALPMSYPPPVQVEDSQDKMLSVSGKKKCSNCGNELGRGAAMIIESLCLFYHMDCFKCCVCHMQLGDGLMGTDVRVRNQKLHCHNCYSSEDGVKFSCV